MLPPLLPAVYLLCFVQVRTRFFRGNIPLLLERFLLPGCHEAAAAAGVCVALFNENTADEMCLGLEEELYKKWMINI